MHHDHLSHFPRHGEDVPFCMWEAVGKTIVVGIVDSMTLQRDYLLDNSVFSSIRSFD